MKIVSGGQTGVDQAALDVAIAMGIDCGGWCPLGRRSEEGPIDMKYSLKETPTRDYPQRTEWNIRDSDGTLILTRGKPDGGTALTRRLARALKKPCRTVDFEKRDFPEVVAAWLCENEILTLNVAGPRESSQIGIHDEAAEYLKMVFEAWKRKRETSHE